jgi:DNA-binding MarR family transcriptional regulator
VAKKLVKNNSAHSATRRGSLSRIRAVEASLDGRVTNVLSLFRVIFRSVRRHNQFILDESGLSAMHIRALALVEARDGIGVSDLAKSLMIHQPSASKLVDDLASRSLLERSRSEHDRRAVRLTIRPQGRTKLARSPSPVFGVLPDALRRLDAAELTRLERGLAELLQAMRLRDDRARFVPLSDD